MAQFYSLRHSCNFNVVFRTDKFALIKLDQIQFESADEIYRNMQPLKKNPYTRMEHLCDTPNLKYPELVIIERTSNYTQTKTIRETCSMLYDEACRHISVSKLNRLLDDLKYSDVLTHMFLKNSGECCKSPSDKRYFTLGPNFCDSDTRNGSLIPLVNNSLVLNATHVAIICHNDMYLYSKDVFLGMDAHQIKAKHPEVALIESYDCSRNSYVPQSNLCRHIPEKISSMTVDDILAKWKGNKKGSKVATFKSCFSSNPNLVITSQTKDKKFLICIVSEYDRDINNKPIIGNNNKMSMSSFWKLLPHFKIINSTIKKGVLFCLCQISNSTNHSLINLIYSHVINNKQDTSHYINVVPFENVKNEILGD